jgi:N-acetylneuraminic acid mutarotase
MQRAQTALCTAAAALFTVASTAALAQAPATPGQTPPAAGTQQMETTYLVSTLQGADVYSLNGSRKIADLADIVVSERGQIVALILSQPGASGARHVAVNPAYFRLRPISTTEVRVETNLTADQLRDVPAFDYPARRR